MNGFTEQHLQQLSNFEDELDRAFGFLMEKRHHAPDEDLTGCTSYIQRKLQCGYNRAATLLDLMVQRNWITEADGRGARRLIRPST